MTDRLSPHVSEDIFLSRVGLRPEWIERVVCDHVLAIVKDLKYTHRGDLKVAAALTPSIAVGAARAGVELGEPLPRITGSIMKGLIVGMGRIGGPSPIVAHHAAQAIVTEATRLDADSVATAGAAVRGAFGGVSTTSHSADHLVNAAVRGAVVAGGRRFGGTEQFQADLCEELLDLPADLLATGPLH